MQVGIASTCNLSEMWWGPGAYSPLENITKMIHPKYIYVILGSVTANYVITKKSIPQELFCVVGGCRDLRLFHVELRDIHAPPENILFRELLAAIGYEKLSHSPRK